MERKSLRVLIVEDEATINELICSRVRELGHEVAGRAFDAPRAVQLTQELRPDVILMDLHMTDPRTGREERAAGLTAARTIQAQCPTPIVVLTAYETPELLQRASEVGAGAYLLKPPDTPELARSITIAVARFSDLQEMRRLNAELEAEIAERKHVEDALRESEEKYRTLIEYMQDGVFVVQDEKVKFINEACAQMLGYTVAELIGMNFREVVAPEDLEMVADNYRRRQAGEAAPSAYEWRMLHKDGATRVYVSMSVGLIKYQGRVASMGTVKDVTARKRAEDALRESEERFRSVVQTSPVGIALVDKDGNLFECNQALAEIMGYSRAEMLSLNVAAITHPDDLARERELISAVLAGEGDGYRIEKRYVRKDGNIIWVDVVSAIVRNGTSGEASFGFAFVQDITERKRMEEEREGYAVELQRSNEDLQQFAYTVSHDLKEPLRMIKSYLGLLERRYKDQLDDSANDFIFYAVDGAVRMEKLIKNLLEYARVDTTGKEPTWVDCEEIIKEVLAGLQVQIADCNAVVAHESLPRVCADATQLGQLLQNLIGNALKFRGEEPPRVHISASPVCSSPQAPPQRSEGEWCFAVRDNGIGIAAKDYERVFGVFQQLHARGEYEGTGIGLAICKKIVTRHGGRIWVESEVGQGTTFYFTLPGCGGQDAADAARS